MTTRHTSSSPWLPSRWPRPRCRRTPRNAADDTIGTEAEFSGFNHVKAKIFNRTPRRGLVDLERYSPMTARHRAAPGPHAHRSARPAECGRHLAPRREIHDGTPSTDAVVHHYTLMAPTSGVNTS